MERPEVRLPFDQRRLLLFNALYLALAQRGHDASASERDGRIDATIRIGDTSLDIDVVVAGSHRKVRLYGRDRPAPDLPASTSAQASDRQR